MASNNGMDGTVGDMGENMTAACAARCAPAYFVLVTPVLVAFTCRCPAGLCAVGLSSVLRTHALHAFTCRLPHRATVHTTPAAYTTCAHALRGMAWLARSGLLTPTCLPHRTIPAAFLPLSPAAFRLLRTRCMHHHCYTARAAPLQLPAHYLPAVAALASYYRARLLLPPPRLPPSCLL